MATDRFTPARTLETEPDMQPIAPTIEQMAAKLRAHSKNGNGTPLSTLSANRPTDANTEPAPCRCGGAGWFVLDVEVGHPDFGKLMMCDCKRRELEQSQRSKARAACERLHSELGSLANCTFETFRSSWSTIPEFNADLDVAMEICQRYAAQPHGWLYLWGSYGTGKSHLAAALANALAGRGMETTYASVPRLLRFLRQGFQPGIGELSADGRLEMLCQVTVLILDDIGAERATAWANEKLFELVNERYQADLPIVFTSNAKPEDAIREERVVDRIYGMASLIQLSGPSYRRRLQESALDQ